MPRLACALVCAVVVALLPASAAAAPTATGHGGAAATVDANATAAAMWALDHGGNAVDATVAAAAVLGVTEPFSCGIGGGGFMVISTPGKHGRVTTIDHREKAPAAMRPDSFFENGVPLAFDPARFSGISAGVPGTVAGWEEALDRYGKKKLRKLLEPAIAIAQDGFVVDQTFFGQVNAVRDFFDDIPSTRAIYLDADGTPRDVGTTLRNPDMAKTYELIAKHGVDGFYRGAVAEAIVAAVQHPPTAPDANHTWRPGVMTAADLRAYTAPEREPTRISYHGLDVYGMGPPSSGGSTVGQALNMLENDVLSPAARERALHLFLEASRFSFADRGAYLGDPDFFAVPLRGLLSDSFAAERRALIGETAAASPVAPGDPYPHQGGTAPGAPLSVAATRTGSTTHLSVTDKKGMVVSYTFTIESTGGNGIVVPGWGFLLNNELTDFNFNSTAPHPNRVEGNKRPRSSMSPTIVERDGEPLLTVGTPGGSTIITTVLQILLDRLDLGATLPQAIAAPRASQRNTAATQIEAAFDGTAEAAALRARGHTLTVGAEIGAATGIEFLPDGRRLAAAEPVRRGGGSAAVQKP